jgi:hypothetical protein
MESRQNYTSLSASAIFGALILFSLYMMLPNSIQAHGAGMTFSATTTEGYIIDVDYSDLSIVADNIGRFDFNLFLDANRTKPVPFTDLWVRIEQKNEGKRDRTLYAGSVAKMQFGGTGFSLVFPTEGKYTLSVRYNDSTIGNLGDTVAEDEFELDVVRPYDKPVFAYTSREFLGGLGGGALVSITVAGAYLFWRRKKNA